MADKDDLDARQTPAKKVPAWQLREQMKNRPRMQNESIHSCRGTSLPKSPTKSRDIDPSLPPAFRAIANRQRKKELDEFNNMDSVHSSKSLLTATQTYNGSDSDIDSDNSFDGHDSFASLGEDDDDDEAYRESRNQIARQTVETHATPTNVLKSDFRLKKTSLGTGTTLDFIAE
jgi:hypothetical protein